MALIALMVILPVVAVNTKCQITDNLYDVLAQDMIDNLNITGNFVNVTDTYCYTGNGYTGVNIVIVSKDNASSIEGNKVRVSLSSSSFQDYDAVLNKRERNALDYQLKQMYVNYMLKGENKEFYVVLNP